MKTTIVSDLHLEFGPYGHDLPGGDLLLLPGDITVAVHHAAVANPDFMARYPDHADGLRAICKNADDFFAEVCPRYGSVLAVAGNHEHYGAEVGTTLRILESKYSERHPNLGWLEKEAVIVGDVMVYGATMWTDFNRNDPRTKIFAHGFMHDYQKIWITDNGENRNINPNDVYEDHLEALRVLQIAKDNAAKSNMPLIVMTHHAPSRRSCHPRYAGQYEANGCYNSDLEKYMSPQIPLWVHGHTHESYDYEVRGTRVVCNPRGYTGDKPAVNRNFNPNLVVEL